MPNHVNRLLWNSHEKGTPFLADNCFISGRTALKWGSILIIFKNLTELYKKSTLECLQHTPLGAHFSGIGNFNVNRPYAPYARFSQSLTTSSKQTRPSCHVKDGSPRAILGILSEPTEFATFRGTDDDDRGTCQNHVTRYRWCDWLRRRKYQKIFFLKLWLKNKYS